MSETMAQRRAKERTELVRAHENKVREVVEAEALLARLRREQTELRDQLLAVVAPRPKRPEAPERVLAVARLLHDSPTPLSRADVAKVLGITTGNAGMRLTLAVKLNLVERTERGYYCSPGRGASVTTEAKP